MIIKVQFTDPERLHNEESYSWGLVAWIFLGRKNRISFVAGLGAGENWNRSDQGGLMEGEKEGRDSLKWGHWGVVWKPRTVGPSRNL